MTISSKASLPSCYNIAHRGAGSLAPENTMAAVKKAWESGAHGIEIDVAVTEDEELVLLHDDLLIRTTDVIRHFPDRICDPVTTFSLKEIQSLDAGSWYVRNDPFGEIAAGNVTSAEQAALQGITIPTLREVLLFVKEKSLYINIEIKKLPHPKETFPVAEKVVQLLDELQIPANCFAISSFAHDYLRQIEKKRPDIEINAIIGFPGSGIQDWGNFEFKVYNANASYTNEEHIQNALEKGCQVNLFAVNEIQEAIRFLRAGVSKFITDYPQRLVALEVK